MELPPGARVDTSDPELEIAVEYFSSWRAPALPGGLQPTTGGRPLVDDEANRLRRLKQRIINERARRAFARGVAQVGAHDDEWLRRLNAVWQAFHRDGSTIDAGVVDHEADDPLFDLFVFDGPTRRCSIDQISSGELELVTIGSMAGVRWACPARALGPRSMGKRTSRVGSFRGGGAYDAVDHAAPVVRSLCSLSMDLRCGGRCGPVCLVSQGGTGGGGARGGRASGGVGGRGEVAGVRHE